MRRWLPTALLLASVFVAAASAAAEPIIKPKKYHGPIPRSSFTLRAGFLGGPDNAEMIEALDKGIKSPFEAFSDNFSDAVDFDATYMYKVHPQFAVRANANAAFLHSDGEGFFVPTVTGLPDSVAAPVVDYTRTFDVDVFVIEASAVYFFADAAVQEFQPYIGGGFSAGIPHAKFNESRVDRDTGKLFQEIDRDEWSVEPGIHGFLGASYYVSDEWAFNAESRFQILQSKFPIDVFDRSAGRFEEVDVIVDYTGFMINFGVTRAF